MRAMHLATALLVAASAAAQSHAGSSDAQVRINQIQVIGSHNSYHAGLLPGVRAFLAKEKPDSLRGLDYAHPPLNEQFDGGIRQIELDVYADSKGGRYAHPAGPAAEAAAGVPVDPMQNFSGASADVMMKPGFKVMHVQDLDQHSSCQPFTACLKVVRDWSKAHPRHLPIFVLVETKQGKPLNIPNATTPEPFTSATFDALDREIRSVFAADEMITPDDLRSTYATPNEAARAGAWPTLETARGKVIFLMDQRKVGPVYLEGHPDLRGRVLFTNAVPGQPDAAFTEENDGTQAEIAALVKQGYLVRTRTDADTKEGRSGSTVRRDLAMASGAQMLSTDYPKAEPARWTGYSVSFPGGVMARCNPVARNAACSDAALHP
ncbi:MAG TPA: phosphatidylinositol-specific phospholipase C1-like protein [Acidobacteriaceae bacterium]|nr:phosphatidylinositol-specific phospholipase C1-like protein [Acidobacteriaceae bacterium]